jgi:hypothetical protein
MNRSMGYTMQPPHVRNRLASVRELLQGLIQARSESSFLAAHSGMSVFVLTIFLLS